MYHKICLVSVLVLLCTNTINTLAQQSEDSLTWEKGRKLTWEDFRGAHDEVPIIGARTFTSIKYKLFKSDTNCRVDVRCIFLKKISWKADADTTTYALQHEQNHFDISELYARKLRKAFKEYSYNKKTVDRDISAIFNKICAEKTTFNNLYDRETIYSLDKTRQVEWNNRITILLEELKEYASN